VNRAAFGEISRPITRVEYSEALQAAPDCLVLAEY
jgi:hypothetical protein